LIAVADSSPLIILAKLGCLDFLKRVFSRVYVSREVHYETVVAGAGLPGASEVSNADWIEVKSIQDPAVLREAQRTHGLGPGEMSTISLAKALSANPVLLDDHRRVGWPRPKASKFWEASVCLKLSIDTNI
jgi:predicted nucleic acid-binding protein